jgi:hypothetical protein
MASMTDRLQRVNACLAEYNVTLYEGADGRLRIWGDINRIQDIVDGPCMKLAPKRTLKELGEFFTTEVDGVLMECLQEAGVDASIDPGSGQGISIKGKEPSLKVRNACVRIAYEKFSGPPKNED